MAETKEQYNLKESIAEIFLNIKDTEMETKDYWKKKEDELFELAAKETKCPTCGHVIKE